ncbi:methyltransferase [Streptomyces sp. Amel2xB2]|uniref:methyltransferase n=1 Tax=Streptomyces sp. Amel2xB2 TaxID=1305829 RepID=UPI0021ABC694|nr:methyltransferase [Streptomyces sp. Amel2xB2]
MVSVKAQDDQAAAMELVGKLEHLAVGAGVAAALQAAVKLGVPEAVGDDPVEVSEIAARTDAVPGTLGRLLRALERQGVFEETSDGRYRHNALSRLLRDDSPYGLKHLVLWLGAPWTWQAWPRLDEAVRDGKAMVPEIFGKDFYSYLTQDAPESARVFDKAMTAVSSLSSRQVSTAIDLRGVGSVADVAGGQGHLLRTLLARHPGVHGTLFDLEATVADAVPELCAGGEFGDRCSLVPGDCLNEVPVKADLYILKNILDWPDENSLRVLKNIGATADPGARILVIDSVMDAAPEEMRVTSVIDLFMLLNVGGQRHTRSEFEELFSRAGLDLTGTEAVSGTFPTLHLVEATVPG